MAASEDPPATLATDLADLEDHLSTLMVAADPSALLNVDLFDRINYQLDPVRYPDLTARFLPRLASVIKKIAVLAELPSVGQNDGVIPQEVIPAGSVSSRTAAESKGYPPPLLALTIKLLVPVPFDQALELCTTEYLIKALSSPQRHINELALAVLDKATKMPSDASLLATDPVLLGALLECTLVSPFVEVGQQGVQIIGDLLDVDCLRPQPCFADEQQECYHLRLVQRLAQGHGSIWRRLFGSPVESLLQKTLRKVFWDVLPVSSDDRAVLRQRSIAQSRFLDLIPRIMALDPQPLMVPDAAIAQSLLGPDATRVSPSDRPVSLLEWATLDMVDRTNDGLMYLTWVDYMKKLVGVVRVADTERMVVDTLRRLVFMTQDTDMVTQLYTMLDNRDRVWTPPGEVDAMEAYLEEIAPLAAQD